jgi:alpha-ketoglutarate-dependent taurine dioxygenase
MAPFHVEGGALPLVVRPAGGARALPALFCDERAALERLLLTHGALLFRDFDVARAADLGAVLEADGAQPMRYFGGISPRTSVRGGVYTATELPPGVRIPLHNELSYLATYPRALWFSCAEPAETGGETTLADGRALYQALDRRVRARFVERGVRYRCSFHGPSPLHDLLDHLQKVTKSWMEAFETGERAVVEARCRELGATCRWLPSGRLVLETTRPAIVEHPVSGERAWFNSAHLFHINPRGIGWTRFLLSRLYALGRPDVRTQEATFGDGTPLDPHTLERLFHALDDATVAVRWQRGDLLWIDNLLCMHGRNPYRGERHVLAALTR